MFRQKGKISLLPLVVVLLAVGITAALFHFKPKPEEDEPETPFLSVTVAPIQKGEIEWQTHLQGEVRAKNSINLISEVNGKITDISDAFTEGGMFSAGDSLLLIDKADYLVAVESAKARVAEAKVNLELELANSDIRKKLWQDTGASIKQASPLQLNYPQVAQAKAKLKAAESELDRAELDLGRTRISVPFNGRIKEKFVGIGQFVTRGEPLATIFSTDSVEVRVPMTDKQLSELQLTLGEQLNGKAVSPGGRAVIQKVFGDRLHTWEGQLIGVDATIDPQTRLVYATIRVDDPYVTDQSDHYLPLAPGFYVDVVIDASRSIQGLKVPRNALRRGDSIYLYKDDKLQIRDVEVLQTSSDVAVLAINEELELSQGALVITSPVPGAYEGMAIKLNEMASKLDGDKSSLAGLQKEQDAEAGDKEKTESSL